LDGKGYLYAAGKHSVQVIACATGQLVGEFGSYGNLDCQGPGSPSPHPELPFGLISALSVWQDRLFVVDVLNRRIVKCRIVYEEPKKPVPGGSREHGSPSRVGRRENRTPMGDGTPAGSNAPVSESRQKNGGRNRESPSSHFCSAPWSLSAGILDACRRVIEESWPRGQITELNP